MMPPNSQTVVQSSSFYSCFYSPIFNQLHVTRSYKTNTFTLGQKVSREHLKRTWEITVLALWMFQKGIHIHADTHVYEAQAILLQLAISILRANSGPWEPKTFHFCCWALNAMPSICLLIQWKKPYTILFFFHHRNYSWCPTQVRKEN